MSEFDQSDEEDEDDGFSIAKVYEGTGKDKYSHHHHTLDDRGEEVIRKEEIDNNQFLQGETLSVRKIGGASGRIEVPKGYNPFKGG
jgi:hypothetical protein